MTGGKFSVDKKVMCSPSLHYSFCGTDVEHNDLVVGVCHAPWRGCLRETPPLAEQKEWELFNRWCLHSCAHFISVGCQFLQSFPHVRFCSVVVDGAWFVGDSRWYRVSFPITGPSYLSNTLCSVGITELAQCVYVKPSIGRVGGWGSPSRWFLDSVVSAVLVLQLISWRCLQRFSVCNLQSCFGLLAFGWPFHFWRIQFTCNYFCAAFRCQFKQRNSRDSFDWSAFTIWMSMIALKISWKKFTGLLLRQSHFWIVIWTIHISRSAGFKISLRSHPTRPLGCGAILTHSWGSRKETIGSMTGGKFSVDKKVMCSPSLHYSFCETDVEHNDLVVGVCHAPWRGCLRETPPLAEQKEWELFNRWCLHSCAHFISVGCQFLQSFPHVRFCSVVVDGAWFVGDSRWYRVSFPITGPSYLSNTLCSVVSERQKKSFKSSSLLSEEDEFGRSAWDFVASSFGDEETRFWLGDCESSISAVSFAVCSFVNTWWVQSFLTDSWRT